MTTKDNGYKDCNNRKKFIPNIDFLKNKYNIAYLLSLQLYKQSLKDINYF